MILNLGLLPGQFKNSKKMKVKNVKYEQKSLFLDQVRIEVCNNIVKHCMLQDVKNSKPQRPESIRIKKYII
jgi:hypothetical protein